MMKSDSWSDGSCRMRERMSLAGRREGLDLWVWCAAFLAFFARDRDVVGLRDGDGDGVEDEEEVDESLSSAGAFSVVGGCREIMSLPGSRDEYAFMLAKERSGSSNSLGLTVEAMTFYDGSWRYLTKIRCVEKQSDSGKANLSAGYFVHNDFNSRFIITV